MDTDLTDAPGSGTPATATRRRMLGAGIAGAALSLLPMAVRRAGAQSDSTTPSSGATTAPPKRPTEADVTLLAFAQAVELAAVELYRTAVKAGGLDQSQNLVLATLLEAHRAFADSISALLGRAAPGETAQSVVAGRRSGFGSSSITARLAAASELESALVATHRQIIGQLAGTDGAARVASILVAEARHGTLLADVAGATDLGSLLVDREATAIKAGG